MTTALCPGGRLLVNSDHLDYGEVIAEILGGAPGLEALDAAAAFDGLPLTGFEVKYLDQGRPIRSFAFQKPSQKP